VEIKGEAVGPGVQDAMRRVLVRATGRRESAGDPAFAALVADALDRFHIVGKKDLYPRQLSGGQQQLIAVARAIIAKPALLLADEPTGNLHSAQGREIMELFCKLNAAGTTIVQVTHSQENAQYGGRIVELKDGWMVGDERVASAATSGALGHKP